MKKQGTKYKVDNVYIEHYQVLFHCSVKLLNIH